MLTIKNILETVFRQNSKWNYYGGKFDDNIFSSEGCRSFVFNFFEKSSKSEPIHFLESEGLLNLPSERWQHIVYVFLLGIYVYQSPQRIIDEEIQKLDNMIDNKSSIKFEFVWFLVCLSHDLFLNFEDDMSREKFLDIKKHKLGKIHGVPKLFEDLPIKYYFYRRLYGKNDHGIYAGLTMYSQLCNIRKKQEKSYNGNNHLYWGKSLEQVYNYASWIVACHNIWFKHSNNKSETLNCTLYKQFGLDELILDDNGAVYKEECKKFPIFRLFCIIDTIEMIKVICDTSELEKIKMEVTAEKILIDVSESKDKERLKSNIESLDSWIADIEPAGKDNNYIFTIKL